MAEGGGSKGWKNINYKQDLPPPGGYGKIPFMRNIPVRGPSGAILFGMAGVLLYTGRQVWVNSQPLRDMEAREQGESEMALFPLLEAERDRSVLREYKEMMESEALNIVGTGYDPDHVPGQFGVYNIKRWREPFLPDKKYQLPASINFWYDMVYHQDVPGP